MTQPIPTHAAQPCQPVPATAALCCPRPGTNLASQHPRVYLEPDASGKALCPYCGACYQAA